LETGKTATKMRLKSGKIAAKNIQGHAGLRPFFLATNTVAAINPRYTVGNNMLASMAARV
jgi:hypothetical protein